MKQKVLNIINEIRAAKELAPVESINNDTNMRMSLTLTSLRTGWYQPLEKSTLSFPSNGILIRHRNVQL